jgi:uncharacterized protein
MTAAQKLVRLKAILSEAGSVIIALSGGTDSTFLVSVAAGLPGLRVLAVTVSTPYMFSSEVDEAARFCRERGVTHREVWFEIPATIVNNPPDRCYLCKKEVMGAISTIAAAEGYAFVFDGTNADDLFDYRPGLKALRETGVRSPLAEAGLVKDEIRMFAREAGLEVSDRPSNACLLTRFPHDTLVNPASLRMAEAAERIAGEAGFRGARVRVHGDLARIELRKEHFEKIAGQDVRMQLVSMLKNVGFRFITFDAEGYRSGSMNKTTES